MYDTQRNSLESIVLSSYFPPCFRNSMLFFFIFNKCKRTYIFIYVCTYTNTCNVIFLNIDMMFPTYVCYNSYCDLCICIFYYIIRMNPCLFNFIFDHDLCHDAINHGYNTSITSLHKGIPQIYF